MSSEFKDVGLKTTASVEPHCKVSELCYIVLTEKIYKKSTLINKFSIIIIFIFNQQLKSFYFLLYRANKFKNQRQ